MIDGNELREMRQRAERASKAIEVVSVHTDGGLFGTLPPEEAVPLLAAAAESARDVPPLIAEVQRLSPAAYLVGPEQCAEGDCSEEEPSAGQRCSHVREAVATFDDVKRAEALAEMIQSVRSRLSEHAESADFAQELVADIDNALEAMEAAESAGWAH